MPLVPAQRPARVLFLKSRNEATALRVRQRVAVCVVRVAVVRLRRQLVQLVVVCNSHSGRRQFVPCRIVTVALRGSTTLPDLGQLVQRIVTIAGRYPVQVARL